MHILANFSNEGRAGRAHIGSRAAAAGTELAGAAYCDTVIVLNMTIGNNVDLHYSRLFDRSPSGIVFTEGNFL